MASMTDFSLALAQAVHDTEREREQDAIALPWVVVRTAGVLDDHRPLVGPDCTCGEWPAGIDHITHVALALYGAGLLREDT